MKALILAGGQGMRLRPLTDDKPKPLVSVGGKPIAERQLDWLIENADLERAVFLCGYKWTRLKEHFGDAYRGVRIEYSVEETPLGTGGAFRKAILAQGLGDEDIVMMNGDIVTSLPLREMVSTQSSLPSSTPGGSPVATILLVPYKSRFGIVRVDGESYVSRFEEKPEFADVWINGGIYVAHAGKILTQLPEKGDIEKETFPKLAAAHQVKAYTYRGFWSLIDSVKDIQEVEKQLDSPHPPKAT